MNGMHFIRKKGRIIPIHDKGNDIGSIIHKTAPYVGAAAGVGTYLALRKFKLSAKLPLARLQVAAKKGGFSLSTNIKNPVLRKVQSAIYGSDMSRSRGVTGNLMAVSTKGENHTLNSSVVSTALDDKKYFAQLFRGFTPKTRAAKAVLKNKSMGLRNTRVTIFKPRDGSMGRIDQFATSQDLRANTAKGKRVLREPERFIAQEKLDLTNEYRAHVLNGKVFGISHRRIPNHTVRKAWNAVSRRVGLGDGGGAVIPVVGAKREEIKTFMHAAIKNSNITSSINKNESFFAAFDIGDTKHGLKLIEANTSPGTFANPIINRHFHRLATGKWGRDVAGAAGLATGGTTYAALRKKDGHRS